MNKKRSHMNWTWILFITFIGASVIDVRFSILALICMISPLVFSSLGKGKIHCSHYCPRGSFLGKFLSKVSMGYGPPFFMKKKYFKHSILGFMLVSLSLSLYRGGLTPYNIGFSLFRLIFATSILGVVLGIFYKPRTWCTICPMGHASGMIKQHKDSINTKESRKNKEVKKAA